MSARRFVVVAALLCAGGAGAQIQMFSPEYGAVGAPMSNFLSTSYLVQEVANGTLGASRSRASASPRADLPAPRFVPAGRPIAPRKLAAGYPEHARAQAEQLFARTLAGYHDIEAKFGLPRNDLAGALATFVAGNVIAYRNEPFPDQRFPPLVNQMRGVLAGSPALRRASDADKQELYEQLAIVGTTMALTREALQKTPNPQVAANLKRTAKAQLEQFLKVDPDRIRIGAEGLAVH